MSSYEDSISMDFPFTSHYINVLDSRIHYVDEGSGTPIVFIHDIPTCNYLWRNIIPELSQYARCIAPDLIGMGKSDKPDIPYRVFDHITYIEAFINTLKLNDIILVMHGWGSVIGFDYARRNAAKIKGLVFAESYLRANTSAKMVSLPIQEIFNFRHDPDGSYKRIMEDNFFIERALLAATMRKLRREELDYYREPFQEPSSRKLLWQYLQDAPLGEQANRDVVNLINEYSTWLQQTQIPKLMMFAVPGLMTTIQEVQWAKQHLPNLQTADLGEALHYPQESNPQAVREAIRDWLKGLK